MYRGQFGGGGGGGEAGGGGGGRAGCRNCADICYSII